MKKSLVVLESSFFLVDYIFLLMTDNPKHVSASNWVSFLSTIQKVSLELPYWEPCSKNAWRFSTHTSTKGKEE